MNLITQYLTRNPCYQEGRTIAVKGLMLHSIGTPQPDPLVFVRNWNKESYDRACVHGFVGGKDVYITLPCLEEGGKAMRGWHGGGSSNNTHIGVEMCEPDTIRYTGGANFEVLDRDAAIGFVEQTTRNAVELFALLCRLHGLNPLTDIISHAEGYQLGVSSNHADPDHLWRQLGMDYSMELFRLDVAEKIKEEKEMAKLDNTPADWAKEAVDWAMKNGLMYGDENGNLLLHSNITREQFITILYRYHQKRDSL